ncbi:hypothetical protein EUTSA_v10019764mg [Eutrema salsugineum]|uniref:LOB domain-containing protein n=1 Tax=Eutrema salsugineum TaxID=72664 RepID=V4KDM2_EUTSA|nr:LOB domain-containing protein 7 [Eutrema salsugineum]ESQ27892.1 hypothetical protein EUTSA_v10019764mg [Eutrema salsugineum]
MSLSKLHGGSSSSATACAACKFQRKKCTKNCLLAPYFPQDRYKQFLNAHRLFGISNITKMLKGIQESERDIAMQNLILHANARALDPVGGVYKIMSDLRRRISYYETELNSIRQEVALYRSLAHPQQMPMQSQSQELSFGCYSYGDLLEQGEEYVNADGYETSKVKLEKEVISNPDQFLSQILMPSQVI